MWGSKRVGGTTASAVAPKPQFVEHEKDEEDTEGLIEADVRFREEDGTLNVIVGKQGRLITSLQGEAYTRQIY